MDDPERKAQIKKHLAYFDAAIELIDAGSFKIRLEEGGFGTFVPKAEQWALYKKIRACIAKGEPARIIILKARQLGFSTAIAVLFFALTLVREAVETIVTAHEKTSADKIYRMYRTCLQQMPDEDRPRTKFDSKHEIVFSATDSRTAVEVAKEGALGRSGTVTYAHLSEMAWWKEKAETFNACMSAVPRLIGTIAVVETTANGYGDEFHKQWTMAEKGKNEWVPVFVPWHTDKKYEKTPPKSFVLDPDEKILAREYKLSDAQICWRRWAIANICGGDINLFDREFPTSPDHAFRSAGALVFDHHGLEHQIKEHNREPRGTFNISLSMGQKVVLYPDHNGPFRIYEEPCNGSHLRECIIGADPADSEDPDNCDAAAVVIDIGTREIVAVWQGHCKASAFGDIIVAIAEHFNHARIACEVNPPGNGTMDRVYNELGYHNVHFHKVIGVAGSEPTWKYGWRTTTDTRPILLTTLQRLVYERMIAIPDMATIMEMQSFREIKGRKKGRKREKDDLVMALAIGAFVASKQCGWLSSANFFETSTRKPKRQMPWEVTGHKRIKKLLQRKRRKRWQKTLRSFN